MAKKCDLKKNIQYKFVFGKDTKHYGKKPVPFPTMLLKAFFFIFVTNEEYTK